MKKYRTLSINDVSRLFLTPSPPRALSTSITKRLTLLPLHVWRHLWMVPWRVCVYDNFISKIGFKSSYSLLLSQHWKQNVWLAGLATPFLYLSVMGCLNLTIVFTLALKAGINATSYIPFLGLFLSSAFAFLSLTIFLAQKENKKWEGVPDKDEEKDQILKANDSCLSHEEKGDVLINQTWINP